MASITPSDFEAPSSPGPLPESAPSSPPSAEEFFDIAEDKHLVEEEERARAANKARDAAAATRKKKGRKAPTEAEREAKVKDLEELLGQCEQFRTSLTKKGEAFAESDGKALGAHSLKMAKQPKCMSGGTMRDYQLEGLTWMFQVCEQGLSGILADEMGLGKTCQTISLVALLREQESWYGPHLIVAPLSTLSNWVNEFHHWTPSIPVVMYHGLPKEREQIRKTKILPYLKKGRPTDKFPVVCTSYEMILKDQTHLKDISWEFIIVDEGHRMKNFESRLFQVFERFRSATRFLITGTPLQNNLKELWSLLHFLLPTIFTDWEAFDTWFNFSGLEDEEGTKQLLSDARQQDLVKKMHFILQPLLLRRVKADVVDLPPKREYILYAPMTKEQTDLYNAIADRNVDTRAYLQDKVVRSLSTPNTPGVDSLPTPIPSRPGSAKPTGSIKRDESVDSRDVKRSLRKKIDATRDNVEGSEEEQLPAVTNAFAMMMEKRGRGRPIKAKTEIPTPAITPKRSNAGKRKIAAKAETPPVKTPKSSGTSTPVDSRSRGRPRKAPRKYKDADSSDDDLEDDEFEEKLAREYVEESDHAEDVPMTPADVERAKTLELAKREIAGKKLGNAMMQLRLACNSPHMFYNLRSADGERIVDESIVTASGKMLLLDRLLPALIKRGHKILIFSQFAIQLDILEDYCRHLRQWEVSRIDGSVAQADRRAQIDDFNNDPQRRIFLLSTRAGGQGINLASADTVILFDSDWNPQQDLQAQDRAHRIGQKRPVIVFRLATRGTVEDGLLMSADAKRRLEKLVIKKGEFKNLSQKMADLNDKSEDLEQLRSLLLKDGQVYETAGVGGVISNDDLKILLDRSESAYARAATGQGNAAGYTVIETGTDGTIKAMKAAA